jgi:hypothetical protein
MLIQNSSFGVQCGSTFILQQMVIKFMVGMMSRYQSTFNKQNNTYSDPVSISELNSVYHRRPLKYTMTGRYLLSENFNEKVFRKIKLKTEI